ncbi:conserved hypothetical protein [Talaromyces stipitatus ATCC 10500]|uniref:Uncharacterized protein n=1 Tax=Talaromyces stipitatus (strain ATCC 10500 / CBS 375.48 / QM 6759 / NRRL 1006) TaxID=441959 RepID=B8LZ98_TALSN|nr:uncharacterized protein TSTA_088870 [Talaromyces stipitatus ATCC 10500]EED21651.1 conserved hypothetical protein [Talaromyces stipitatus ATCC 10500]
MVELAKVRSSNKRIATALLSGLSLFGRSKEAADSIIVDPKTTKLEGEIPSSRQTSVSSWRPTKVCEQIKGNETAINLLFQSQGSLATGGKTSEQLHYSVALAHYSRARFIANLLPLLQQATSLRRLLSVFAGTKEGQIHLDDLQAWKLPLSAVRGHMTFLITLTMAHFADQAPTVSFVHDFPAFVKSNIGRGTKGIIRVANIVTNILEPFISVPPEEWEEGSGVYTVDNLGEEGGPAVVQTLAICAVEMLLRRSGMMWLKNLFVLQVSKLFKSED